MTRNTHAVFSSRKAKRRSRCVVALGEMVLEMATALSHCLNFLCCMLDLYRVSTYIDPQPSPELPPFSGLYQTREPCLELRRIQHVIELQGEVETNVAKGGRIVPDP